MKELENKKGYCYIVIYSNGTIKGGKTINIKQRISVHKINGLKYGTQIEHVFVTNAHEDYHKTEKKLLSILNKKCSTKIGEYFQGISIDNSIQAINGLGLYIVNYEDMFNEVNTVFEQNNLHVKIPESLDKVLQKLADMRTCSKAAIIRDLIKREAELKNL